MKGVSGHSGGNGEVYRYYACSNPQCRKRNIPKDDLEGKVIRSICDHLLQPDSFICQCDICLWNHCDLC